MNFRLPDFAEILPSLIAAAPSAVIITIGAIVLNIVLGRTLSLLARRTNFTEHDIGPLRRALKWIITIVAVVFVLGTFGLNVGGMWGVLSTILAMIAIGFVAVWSVLSNILCTLIIMLSRTFAVGDEVEFVGEQTKGRVIDLNFIYTTLDAGDGSVMQVPNNLFFQKAIRRRHARSAISPAAHMRTRQLEIDSSTSAEPTGENRAAER